MDLSAAQNMFMSLPLDMVAIVVFATVITVDTLRAGASRAIALSLALIAAIVLFKMIPSAYLLGSVVAGLTNPTVQTGIFIGFTVVLALVIHRATSSLSDDSSRPLPAIITGAATTIIVLSIWQLSPELQSIWKFNPMIQSAFGEAYRLYWILIAFIAFAFVKS